MELKELTADHVSLMLSRPELGTVSNALNEVCIGIHVADFESKMGGSPSEVEQILDDIIPSGIIHFTKVTVSGVIGHLTDSESRHEV